ncbi:MAG TPA: sigma-70 family RNA polymerase sigma factor [Myxococcales bacterium]|jgi:RNA polymerase sigma-70 factor (ECF subfamily)
MAPSFHIVYEAEYAYVWNTLRRLGIPRTDLKDLAQDVFLIVYRRFAELDPARPVRPWLFGVAYRVVSNRRRREAGRPGTAGEFPVESLACPAPGPEQAASAAEDRALVAQALDALDLDKRAVFVMHDLDGSGMPEIARELAIPLNTAYSRLRLARQCFAQAVLDARSAPAVGAPASPRSEPSQGKRP